MKTTLLNESGIEMYGMKETILASQGNNLVLTALQSTVGILPASPEVKKALMDGSTLESFEDVLLNETIYLNEKNSKVIETCSSSKEVQKMEDCSRCEKPKNDLVECEGCNQNVCGDCCVGITYHNMIDFPFCKDCELFRE